VALRLAPIWFGRQGQGPTIPHGTAREAARSRLLAQWLKHEWGVNGLSRTLQNPVPLDSDTFPSAVREVLPKKRKLTASEIAEFPVLPRNGVATRDADFRSNCWGDLSLSRADYPAVADRLVAAGADITAPANGAGLTLLAMAWDNPVMQQALGRLGGLDTA
jgi:hypothetical protein